MQGCDDAETRDADCGPDMWWDDFPHQNEPLEEDIGDVEDGKKPLVVWGGEVELFLHACDFGVAGKILVQERAGW